MHSINAEMSAIISTVVPQGKLSYLFSKPIQPIEPSNQRATLHYLPQVSKQGHFNLDSCVSQILTPSSCRRDMDSVDEQMITRLCYDLGLDKLYVLPDLGLGADIVDRM